jgi:hypothetical protein
LSLVYGSERSVALERVVCMTVWAGQPADMHSEARSTDAPPTKFCMLHAGSDCK